MFSMQKYTVCRLCLCTGGLKDIFHEEIKLEFVVKDTIQDLMQFEVEKEDGFPWMICRTCLAKLTEFQLFKRRCVECKLAFDMRFRSNSKPPDGVSQRAKGTCSKEGMVERSPEEGIGEEAWVVVDSLYCEQEAGRAVDDCSSEEGIGDESSSQVGREKPEVSSIIQISREPVDMSNIKVEPLEESECIGIDELADEEEVIVFKPEPLDESESVVGISAPSDEVEVSQMKLEHFEAGSVPVCDGSEEEVSVFKLEPLDERESVVGISAPSDEVEVSQMKLEHFEAGSVPVCDGSEVDVTHVKVEEPYLAGEVAMECTKVSVNHVVGEPLENQSFVPDQPLQWPKYKRKKSCFVPECPNSWLNSPWKHFITVPKGKRRLLWFQAVNRRDFTRSTLYCCEDHFDKEIDFQNYKRLQYVGGKSLRLNRNAVPRYLDCHGDQPAKSHRRKQKLNCEKIQQKTMNELYNAKGWAKSEERRSASSSDGDPDGKRGGPTPRAPRWDHPARLSGGMGKHTLEKIVGKGKKRYPSRMCRVCSAKKLRKETRYICAFCKVPLHKGICFTQYHTKKNY